MAGGIFGAEVPCMYCEGRAVRTYEGLEDDHYRCEAGHTFGIDWSVTGPPTGPVEPSPYKWPLPDAPRQAPAEGQDRASSQETSQPARPASEKHR